MEKEKILDKMRELRDVRDLQILSKELENINLDVDYKKDLSKENKKYLLKQLDNNIVLTSKDTDIKVKMIANNLSIIINKMFA